MVAFCLAVAHPIPGHASSQPVDEIALTDWADLIPSEVVDYEDPFLALEDSELYLLGQIARLRDRGISAEKATEAGQRLSALEDEARAAGLDLDYLWSIRGEITALRNRAATEPNEALAGQRLSLVGFAVPGMPTAEGETTFYLVPERGMCSHTPPPHPNQMVRIIVDPEDTPQYLHQPVRISGPLETERSVVEQFVLDGPVRMDAAYSMMADRVEFYGAPTDRVRDFWRGSRQ
jgi:hypothetical protein